MLPKKMPPKKADNKIGDYSLNQKFTNGYHNREDPTALPIGTLVTPSQNVLVGTSGRVGTVAGYTLDGPGSSSIDSGILSNIDFLITGGFIRNLRAGFLTVAGNDGKLQFRYQNTDGSISWIDLETSMSNVTLSFAEFWDVTEKLKLLLWVDGTKNIFEWNGAETTFASATAPQSGVIQTLNATPTAGGMSYRVGDIVTIDGGTQGQAIVTSISGGGSFGPVTGVSLYTPGITGYSVASGVTTTATGIGVGTGLTVNITAVFSASTITKQGTQTWKEAGFYSTRNKQIVINGTVYTYMGGENSITLQGVTPDPTLSPITVGTLIYQQYVTNAFTNGGIVTTDTTNGSEIIDTEFFPTVIGCGRNNQIYLGSATSNTLYISQVNNMFFYTFSFPVRKISEGASVVLDAPATSFIALESRNDDNEYDLYVSEGLNTWSVIQTIRDSTLEFETINRVRMKVSSLQGAQTERLVSKMKNHIIYIAQDNTANFLGYVSYLYIPETVDFSWPIINDMNSYDFTDGCIYYFKNYIFVAIPKHGIIRMYNMTDQTKQQTGSIRGVEDVDADQPWFWEAPITYPISGFYVVENDLYGHSYQASESYKLFTGGTFNGQNIAATATFCFDDKGDRTQSKASDEIFVEGYIKQNTLLSINVIGDLDYFQNSQTRVLDGSNSKLVGFGGGGHSLGQTSLGSKPLGGSDTITSNLPAWFHGALTYPEVPSYLEQVSFSSNGADLAWEIITFGTNAKFTNEGNNAITD